MKIFKIGTSGFSFSDWKGTIYPATISSREMLSYYVSELGFDTVEINSSYYRMPESKNMQAMSEKTPQDFEFVIKGFRGMTHDPFDNRLESRPTQETVEDYFHKFSEAIEPINKAGKGGALVKVGVRNIQQSVLTSFDAISKKAQKQLLKQIDCGLFEQDGVMLARENR